MQLNSGLFLFFCVFFLTSLSPLYSSAETKWETVFYSDTVFTYSASNLGEPASNWREPDFDDTGWLTGKGGIGYGDNDDNTIIEQTNTLFLRRKFSIHNKAEILQMLLGIDYDDAFVAYLNGNEIARSGGLSDGFPGYDEIATLNHEAVIYQGGVPENFTLNNQVLSQNLFTGENVLAIEIHNSSVSSSDMSSSVFLFVENEAENQQYLDLPDWFVPPFSFNSSNLPIFVITTDGKTIVNEPKTNVHLGVISNGPGERNFMGDNYNHYNNTIGIELRGNSTQSFPKKPYTFETRLADGSNNNVSLLGFPEENDWILRASYYDHTFIRNPLAHYMSRKMGNWSSGNKHCEVVLDGEYQGVYILLEKIKRTKNRLNISKLKPDEIAGEDLTGGYIFEVAGQHNQFGQARRLRYPDFDEVAPEQLAYIQKYDDDFRSAMQQLSSEDPASAYNEWIDLLTFVDYMLVQEASRNPDGYGWSCYFHKDKNGKLRAGPVWDFDQSMYNSTYRDGQRWDGWSIDYNLWPDPPFYQMMMHEPYFKFQLKKRWETLRQNEFSTANLFHYIDSLAANLSEASERNFMKWPNLGNRIWRELPGFELLDTYEKQVYSLKSYLERRWEWMDQELAKVPVFTVVQSQQLGNKIQVYPNPAINYLNIDLELKHSQRVKINIINTAGIQIIQSTLEYFSAGNNHKHIVLPSSMNPGLYILQVQTENGAVFTERFIKK